MLYTKDGYPDVNEIVKCTVTKIYGNTVFLTVDEYEKEGVLTISEIAPGRIRNLRDHVTEQKVIICKVIRVDGKQNRIDLSLRRVSVPAMKQKQEELKKEDYAERIYGDIAKELGSTKDKLFEKTYEPIFEEYITVYDALYDVMLDNKKIDMFTDLTDKEKEVFINIIDERVKPEEITFKKTFKLSSQAQNGVDLVKESLTSVLTSLQYERVTISYLAAGEFEIKIIHEDVKSADKLYSKFRKELELQAREQKLLVELKD